MAGNRECVPRCISEGLLPIALLHPLREQVRDKTKKKTYGNCP